jgi:hypothetical protein
MLKEWWISHDWPPIPEDHLPSTGFIYYNDLKPIMAGFLYLTDSKFSILEFIISNPNSTKDERKEAMEPLINAVVDEAKYRGKSTIFTSVTHPGLLRKLEKTAFVKTDTNMTNLMRKI